MSFSRPDPASPAQVADATFSTGRRGYDQGEVRDFLRMVSSELARLRERELFLERELRSAQHSPHLDAAHLDDEALTRLVGEETARVLNAARESANLIRDKAEQSAARILTEASDEASRRREEAEIEASRRRSDAATDAEAELSMAKQQGREMVNEARAYRERVLSELARRRELAREQIEQLVSGRDRLMQAFERARLVAVDVVAEMEPLGEPDEYVNLSPTTGPVPVMQVRQSRSVTPTEGDPSEMSDAAASLAAAPDVASNDDPAGSDASTSVVDSDADDHGEMTLVQAHPPTGAEENAAADDRTSVAADFYDRADEIDGDAADTPETDTPDTHTPDTHAVEGVATQDDLVEGDSDASESDDETVADMDDDDDDDDGEKDERDDVVVDLFARLRHQAVEADHADDEDSEEDDADDSVDAGDEEVDADAADDAAGDDEVDTDDAETDAAAADGGEIDDVETSDSDAADTAVAVDDTAAADGGDGEAEFVEASEFEQRDADLTPLIVSGARKLKRVLADEQNDVLDGLRRSDPVVALESIIPSASEHTARYLDAIRDDLLVAANAGAQIASPGRTGKLSRTSSKEAVSHAGAMLEEWLVGPLRERLARCVSDGHGDNAVITKKVRSAYREWKIQHIDEQLDDVMRAAHGHGVLGATEPGTGLHWTPDPRHGSCPDCDDNALEPVVAAGTPFPTGHTFAPAHPGCRCMLLVVAP